MGHKPFFYFPLLLLSVILSINCINGANYQEFYQCMSMQPTLTNITQHLYTPNSPNYGPILYAAQQVTMWLNSSTPPDPDSIFTPESEAEIQAAVICSRKNGLQIRVKSGGHDYEGMSFLGQRPYLIVDLTNFRTISIDNATKTAWVQTGATLGELYYHIGKTNTLLGFPGGTCPSVGTGGHISGGGFGMLARKYGLAADNVIDARIVDVNGRILDRKAMGEDLFWAIRGSGGASYGVIVGWKVQLVDVPPVVTAYSVSKEVSQGATKLVRRWQEIAAQMDDRILMRVMLSASYKTPKTAHAFFDTLFLGPMSELRSYLQKTFPEISFNESDARELTWVESAKYFYGFADKPMEALLNRTDAHKQPYKGKSDFILEPMSEAAIDGIFERILKSAAPTSMVILDPFGGKLSEIPETVLPFPHRKGILCNVQYLVKWTYTNDPKTEIYKEWIREIYDYMEPFVSKNPRASYINYKDLEIGKNDVAKMTYEQGKVWGEKYFKGNFERLAKVKAKVDPENYFRNEQSIPPFPQSC